MLAASQPGTLTPTAEVTQLAQQFAQIEQRLENDNAVQEALVGELDYAVRAMGEVEDGWLDHTTGLYEALAVPKRVRTKPYEHRPKR